MALPSPRDPAELRATLTDWLSEKVGEPVELGEPGGAPASGFSNETILIDAVWDDGEGSGPVIHGLVLRVQPTDHAVFPDGRFDAQHRVMAALGAHTDVPVPQLRWFEDDPTVLGSPFMVMGRVDGEAPSDTPPYSTEGWLKDAGPEVQSAVWGRGLDAMSAVHGADWRALDLADLDPVPDGGSRLCARVEEMAAMLQWASPDVRQAVPEAGLAWLRDNQPPDIDDPALCWGDSRIGNQLFAGRQAAATVRVAAVLDWEMVHVGDPVQDLGWFTWMDHTLSAGLEQPRLPGFPPTGATLERWEAATGRSAAHHRWAEILAGVGFAVVMVRLTALLKGSELFPPESDFERSNMGCVALERALADLDVHPSDMER